MRKIEIEWLELGKQVNATLLDQVNPALCDLLWKHLPYLTIQTHALVSGDHLYHIAPIVELVTTEAAHKEDRTQSADGTIFLSQLQHLAIKCGELSEYLPAAPVALVEREHLATLKAVALECWQAIHDHKRVVRVRVARHGDAAREPYFPRFPAVRGAVARQLVDQILVETKQIWLNPPQEVLDIHEGRIKSGAGSRGQYFSTLVFVNGETRPLGYGGYGGLMQLARKPGVTLPTLKQVTPHFVQTPSEFLGYCGLDTLCRLNREFLRVLSDLSDVEDYFALVASLGLYTNQLNAWNLHYFPWHIGSGFRHRADGLSSPP